jgi:hypothetical protein
MTTHHAILTWGRFATAMAIGAAPIVLATMTIPLYARFIRFEAGFVPVWVAYNVTPVVCLLSAAVGVVRAFLAKDPAAREAAWGAAAAGGLAFVAFVVPLALVGVGLMWILATGDR